MTCKIYSVNYIDANAKNIYQTSHVVNHIKTIASFYEQLLDLFLRMKQMVDNRVCKMYVCQIFHATVHKKCVRVLLTLK